MDQALIFTACKAGDLPRLQNAVEVHGKNTTESLQLLREELPCKDVEKLIELSISGKHLEVLKYLWPIFPKKIDRSMAMSAIHTGSKEIFSLLATHDPSILTSNYGHYGNPISCAIYLPNALDFIRSLLQQGADPNGARCAPLHVPVNQAAIWSNIEVMKMLLEHKATLNGTRALWSATGKGDLEMVRFLLVKGMDPNSPGPENDIPPLHRAIESGNLEVISLLLDHGADPVGRDDKGNSPLSVAQNLENLDVTALISEHITANASNDNGT